MTIFNFKTRASLLATATLVAFGVTLYGGQAASQGKDASEPTAVASFDRAGVGGRSGCDVQSWPNIPVECLTRDDGTTVEPVLRHL